MHQRMRILVAATTIAFVIDASTAAMAAETSTSTKMPQTGVMLRSVKDPKQALANASVDDSSGSAVGHVQSVETFKSGHARAVMVSLTDGNKTVAIPARELRYDKASNTVDARLTKTQIEALPAHS